MNYIRTTYWIMFTQVSYNLPEHFQANVTPEQRAKHAPRPMFLWYYAAQQAVWYFITSAVNWIILYSISIIRRFRERNFYNKKDNLRPTLFLRLCFYVSCIFFQLCGFYVAHWTGLEVTSSIPGSHSSRNNILKSTFSSTNLLRGIENRLEFFC